MNRFDMSGKQVFLAAALLTAAAAVAACGGGGGSSLTGATANQPGAPGNTSPGTGNALGKATFSLTVPSTTTSSAVRSPKFVSPNAQSISIAVTNNGVAGPATVANLTSGSPNCTSGTSGLTCTITVAAPIGSDSFVVLLYAGQNGGGAVLSSATVAGTVVAQQGNTIPITLGGNVASVSISIQKGNNLIPGGYATSLPVTVTAADPSGAAIIGPGNYSNPITLTNSDATGITTLSTTTVSSPSTTVTLTYNPVVGVLLNGATIGATAAGLGTSAVTAGTFMPIIDSFAGYNVQHLFTGTQTVVTTTYPTPPSVATPTVNTVTYSISEPVESYPNQTFNGMSGLFDAGYVETLTQVSPASTAAPEVITVDRYRGYTLTSTGGITYQYFLKNVDVAPSGATTTTVTTYAPTGAGSSDQIAIAPQIAGPSWTSTSNGTRVATGATAYTYTQPDSTDWTEVQTAPNTTTSVANANGTATSTNTTTNVTTTFGVPVPSGTGFIIPVSVSSPVPNPSSTPADWYPGGGFPQSPYFFNLLQFVENGLVSIPGSCSVPASIATAAFDLNQTTNQLQIPFNNYISATQDTYTVHGGVGVVCVTSTSTTYAFFQNSGLPKSTTVTTMISGVQSTGALGLKRSK